MNGNGLGLAAQAAIDKLPRGEDGLPLEKPQIRSDNGSGYISREFREVMAGNKSESEVKVGLALPVLLLAKRVGSSTSTPMSEASMKKQLVPLGDFDLPRFIDTIVKFISDPSFALPVVDDNIADFGDDGFDDGMEETPLERLQQGRTLFAQFTSGEGSSFGLADGTTFEVPDNYEGEGEFFDECSAYGYLLRIADGMLTIETAVLRDVTLKNIVNAIEDTGIFEKKMNQFIRSMKQQKNVGLK